MGVNVFYSSGDIGLIPPKFLAIYFLSKCFTVLKSQKKEAENPPKYKGTCNEMAGSMKMVIKNRQKQEHRRCRDDGKTQVYIHRSD